MSNTIGAFVFTDNGDGCLTAKWLNRDATTSYPEASKLKEGQESNEKFVGTYITTWIENESKPEGATLLIEKPASGNYKLKWSTGNKIHFIGTAMLHDGLLIGAYWKPD